VKLTELLKKQAEYPKKLIPGSFGVSLSDAMFRIASTLPKEPEFVPEIPEIPLPPSPPWSKGLR